MLKQVAIIVLLVSLAGKLQAQKVESIYVHLYTDSLKKGTYNYINIDGLLSNGRYAPLDSTQINFSSSHGKFFGNSLWLEPDCKEEKVSIKVVLKSNAAIQDNFVMYVKKKTDDQPLKTEKELLDEMRSQKKKRS